MKRSLAVTLVAFAVALSPRLASADEARPVCAVVHADTREAMSARLAELRKDKATRTAVRGLADRSVGRIYGDGYDVIDAIGSDTSDGAQKLLETACIVEALVRIGTPEAMADAVAVTEDHDRLLMGFVRRTMKAAGDRSLAALVIARHDKNPATRHFATITLESMGKRVAGDIVQTKSNQVLADVLHAFGTTHDLDALPVVLSFTNHDRENVRAAARTAVADYGKDALYKLREAYGNLMGVPAPMDWDSARIAKTLFDAFDKARGADVQALVDEGMAQEKLGHHDLAVAAFDKALARQPALPGREAMAGAYVSLAQTLEDTDRDAARAMYQKALALAPAGTRKPQIESALAYLEGQDLLARGVPTREPFDRALALDPGNEKARAVIDRMDTESAERGARWQRWVWGTALGSVAIAAAILFVRRRRKR